MASRLSYSDIRGLVSKNNNSGQDDSIIIAVAWKESGFDPNAKAATSSASGLLQMTRGATKQVGGDFSKIMDPAYNISVGSQYIGLRIQWAHGGLAKGLDGFGTGAGYSTNIISAAKALKENPENGAKSLKSIHP
ncbi:MAG TPA: transglycosylase SLT domain-containing protein [Rhodanobacter sp.]